MLTTYLERAVVTGRLRFIDLTDTPVNYNTIIYPGSSTEPAHVGWMLHVNEANNALEFIDHLQNPQVVNLFGEIERVKGLHDDRYVFAHVLEQFYYTDDEIREREDDHQSNLNVAHSSR